MKLLYSILVVILSIQNCSNQIQDKFPIPIKEVYYQNWVGGVQGGGSGTVFYIEFKKDLPKTLLLKQLYFKEGVVSANKVSDKEFSFSFTGTSNWNRGAETEISDVPQPKPVVPPLSIKEDEAILEYLYNGKIKYFKFTNVKQKEILAYPSVRPRN